MCGIVAVRTTVNNLCMIVMANVAEFIMRPMGIPVVRYVSFGSYAFSFVSFSSRSLTVGGMGFIPERLFDDDDGYTELPCWHFNIYFQIFSFGSLRTVS